MDFELRKFLIFFCNWQKNNPNKMCLKNTMTEITVYKWNVGKLQKIPLHAGVQKHWRVTNEH